jgi:hypothetical protein
VFVTVDEYDGRDFHSGSKFFLFVKKSYLLPIPLQPHDEIETLREQMQLSRLADVPDLRDSHVLAVINNLLDVFAE